MARNIRFFLLLKQAVKKCLESCGLGAALYVGHVGIYSPLYSIGTQGRGVVLKVLVLFCFLIVFDDVHSPYIALNGRFLFVCGSWLQEAKCNFEVVKVTIKPVS